MRVCLPVRLLWIGGLAACLLQGCRGRDGLTGRTVPIEPGTFLMGSREAGVGALPREVEVGAFRMGRCEVTVAEFAEYMNSVPGAGRETPQIRRSRSRFKPRRRLSKHPVSHVSHDAAEAYCQWLSGRSGKMVRLPTETEWEYAARGGIPRARYPWGWGEPEGRACFAATGPRCVGSYEPNPFGLHDMAGNVFEWCAAEAPAAKDAVARGGSWAEKDSRLLRVYQRARFPRGYRDADVGFRIVVEPSAQETDSQTKSRT